MYTTNLPHIVVETNSDTTISTSDDNCNDPNNTMNTWIVPIIESNMTGVLCIVTNNNTYINQYGTKVIQINGTAIFRYQIINILSNGYSNINTIPYIVAQVQLVLRSSSSSSSSLSSTVDSEPLPKSLPISNHITTAQRYQLLPYYMQSIITKYGTTLLSYFDTKDNHQNSTNVSTTIHRDDWMYELYDYYYQLSIRK
jgi:hypothetical protein